jgi:dCMP deaminase
LLLYLPAFHEGVINLFTRQKEAGATQVVLLGRSLSSKVHGAPRDFAVSPQVMAKFVDVLGIFQLPCLVAETDTLLAMVGGQFVAHRHRAVEVVLEEVGLLGGASWDNDFMRWDLPAAMKQSPVSSAISVTDEAFFQGVLLLATEDARRSENFFRQVGAAVMRSGEVLLLAHNQSGHFQGEHLILGNPRVWIDGGHPDINPDIHAEQLLIVEALRRGISFEGADALVTCFPCRTCANMLARTGLKRLFFHEGYSQQGTEQVLVDHGIELFQVLAK